MRLHPRRLIRRHRRPVAAALAGTAAVLALTTLRPTQQLGPAIPANDPRTARAGEVSVPVILASAALAGVLHVGDVIDLVSVADPAAPTRVARDARVLTVPAAGSLLSSASTTVVLVAVPDAAALDVTAAASQEALTFVIPAPPANR